ncbi:uncharacterized protein LOC110060140 [Orbicella faveolata]|uniref:uncharacterized protein LOC110045425 n=1 Tax=Orbicella faveolata TaxID=48498 RepID=UPI0009E4386E|nr:uncharacterized protein LOC110045425 [Orbicella faveolata]XP_020622551.1 uncharacterized protein LOC110060140 [Orbicella faveolata]
MKVSTRVCDTASSIRAFRLLADKVATSNSKDEVYKIFNVLAGDLNITTVKHLLPDDMTDLENDNWKKLHNWKRWWTREEHLKMFTTAFTEMEACNWSACPDTTNPVEHINKDSIPAKEYKNIYRCDKLAAAKRLAVLSNVTIS